MSSSVPDKMKVSSTLWEGIKRVGLDRAEVVRRAALPLNVLKDDTPISTAQFFALWRAIEAVSQDATIGLRIALCLDGAVMPLAFVAAQHARDFRDALNRVARFKRLCAPEDVVLTEDGDRGDIVVHWPHAGSGSIPYSLVDATMVSFLELGRRGTSERLVPIALELARPAASRSALERHFGCQVRFDATEDLIRFRRDDLDKRFATYNKELLEVLAPELDRRLEQHMVSESVAEQTRWVLRRRLTAGRPDIRSVAAELAMSERSLQRRLTDEGVSFQTLMSDTRHQLALEHLADASLTLIEVAYLLGYEDQNSFFRAFRQWEGQTPSAWRATNTEPCLANVQGPR
ncbi:AraC family transcriptional regulator [Sulfuritalea sp.]|uniref:AraC family transcriptional regulator n=1 Tax=Sulfuritalea sp. TaxID=2480090 RepID=UPI00286D7458|nr:AraC family transcriptional regulator ligand-binding domain-containing protein [Sulfuritalea sp.]